MNRFRISLFTDTVKRSAFNCGEAALNDYIQLYASQAIKRNIARVFHATPEDSKNALAGFYTLIAGSISCSELPEAVAKKLPRYPVPVAILGRLAVDLNFQAQGLGSILLADACMRVVNASLILAVAGIVVDAKDSAVDFYRHFGFISLPGNPEKLFLPAKYFLE